MKEVPAEYTDVYLAGELGKKFGRKWRLVCPTPAHAIRLIALAKPEFKEHMLKSASEGMKFHVICDKRSRAEDQLELPSGKRLIISHEVSGAKGRGGSILEVVAGAVLMVASFFVPGGQAYSAYAASALFSVGTSLVLAGITQIISPQAPGTAASFYFNGASNTVTQGQPVPVVYGRMRIGGLPISSSIQAVDLSSAPQVTGLIVN